MFGKLFGKESEDGDKRKRSGDWDRFRERAEAEAKSPRRSFVNPSQQPTQAPNKSDAMTRSTLNAPDREAGGSTSNDSTTTFISKGAEFKGEVAFDGNLELHGRFEGVLTSSDGQLIVGETAVVKANIDVSEVVIFGKVQGNITATGKIELRGNAQVFGDITSDHVTVENGVVFVGRSERLTTSKESTPDFDNIFHQLGKKHDRTPTVERHPKPQIAENGHANKDAEKAKLSDD